MRAAPRRSGAGASSGRDLSPPRHSSSSRGRDHTQRSEWRHYPSRSRQSLSPASRGDHGRRRSTRKRSTSAGRCSVSVERVDYDEAATLSRRHDHGKQHQQQRDRSPPPLPSQSRAGRVAVALDSNLAGNECYDGFHRKYLQTDSPSDVHMDVNPKLARVVKVREFHHPQVVSGGAGLPPSSGAVIDDQGMLVQKSVYLDDGSVRTFFPLPPEQAGYSAEATVLNPGSVSGAPGGGTLRIGVRGAEDLRYHERLKAATYDEEEKQKIYSRDAPYPVVFPSQRRSFGTASSSGTARDEFLVSYRDDLRLPSDSFSRSNGLSKFRGDILSHDEYGQVHLLDTMKQRTLSSPVRDEPRSHGYVELGHRERDDYRFSGSDEPHKKMKWVSRAEYREILGSGFPDAPGRRIDDIEASPRIIRDSRLWEPQHCLEGETIVAYEDMKRVREEYLGGSGSISLAYGTKPSHDGEFVHLGRSYRYGRDTDLVSYRERSRSPPVPERRPEIFRRNLSPRGRIDTEDLDIYDPPFERVVERNYITEEEINILRETRNARAIELSEEDERRADECRMEMMSSRRSGFDHTRHHKMFPRRISEPDAWGPSDDSFAHSEGGRMVNLKRRLKPSSYGSYTMDRRQNFHRPYRFWKKGYEDQQTMNDIDRDVLEDEVPLLKPDPPVDSEEFKHQVDKAFLRFTKMLNEDPHQQKRYRDPGKAHGLLCCVCGSESKEFMDTHSLVTHAFHSHKIGLRTEHLGLHKALCVLVGWNWDVIPDNSRAYQMSPVPEFKALKEDLIVWPPVVVVHNIAIGNKSVTAEPKGATNGCLEELLKGMKFEAGKVKVCRGKPSNQSILLVKFMPTFSGLQEADKLHKYFISKKRGRKELEEAISKESSVKEGESQVEVDQPLYGYMGTMEDLDKLNPESKKRCVIKSKKEIESIADAPLRVV
ncbi:hypothetical protein Taro_009232 [Colocasia esculenta]|uniref:XS domain-containing protein n=1 Tax=Colocasia esculenta TaxID=4460 RepID=A0A843U9E5_COLES|nr:hypothetical protein [Colocasia esculenta]